MVDLLAADALIQVQDATALEQEIIRLLEHPVARKALGVRATATVNRCKGILISIIRQLVRAY
jgi:3-deoxy-D-manno-octulosonic-acid transferase